MLNLILRPEFRGKTLKGTVIELRDSKSTGAIERKASEFLDITYPSIDLLRMAEAIQPGQTRTVVLKGGRGQGKSHMMAAGYHLLSDHGAAVQWRDYWAGRLQDEVVGKLQFREGFLVIAEALHNQRYRFLWDPIFEQHPKGDYIRGKFEARGTDVPSNDDMVELFTAKPTVLILDEFQTWYDGLTNTKQHPRRNWAFNFIQTLSEVAESNPEILALVVSVRDGSTEAYQQIHRVNPTLIDFTGPLVKRDRRRLLLYRMFENRFNIDEASIEECLAPHFSEYCRIRQIPGTDIDKEKADFIEAWPFSPRLLQLLDDQVLMATEAQETRDLIKLLVETFKVAGETSPVLTAADFRIDVPKSAVGSLIDSVANQLHRDLREKALRNLQNINEIVVNPTTEVPHAAEVISSLWLRSLTVDRLTGAHPNDLQIDITRNKPIDENGFRAELSTIREGSFNLHEIGDRLVFKNEENNETKLIAHARNNKLFEDGSDVDYLAKLVHSQLAGSDQSPYRIIVLRKKWESDPWGDLSPEEHPQTWDNRIPVIVLPVFPENEQATLGRWVAKHLDRRRNTPRFLLPQKGAANIFFDPNILIEARAAKLAAEWRTTDKDFGPLQTKFEREVNAKLKAHFQSFAILDKWDFDTPTNCQFQLAKHNKMGAHIPAGIHEAIKETLFLPEEFEDVTLDFARNNSSLADLLKELQEPLSGGRHSIPWLGDAEVKDYLEHMAARGRIAFNVRGTTLVQAFPGENEDEAYPRIRGKLSNVSGSHLAQTTLHEPSAAIAAGGYTQPIPTGGGVPTIPGGTPTGGVAETPGNPFAGGGTTSGGGVAGITSVVPTSSFSAEANSPLNLLGKIEGWGVGGNTKVRTVEISTADFSGKQLQEMLRKLPEGKYTLRIETEEGA